MIVEIEINQVRLLINLNEMIMGRIIEISTSKIKKIIVMMKNWRENGKREEVLGSNPHSKGEYFSRSVFFFFEIIIEIRIKRHTIVIIKIIIFKINIIIYIIVGL